jgi:membrane protein implicated in regulation of membrane protease activity
MVKEIIITLVAGFVIFEIIGHVVFPLVWSFIQRRRGSPCDVSSMIGRTGEVKQWQDLEGKIFINGETWKAKGDFPLLQGDKAIIERVEGLVLTVKKDPTVSRSRRKKQN